MDAELIRIAEKVKGFMPEDEGLALHETAAAYAAARPPRGPNRWPRRCAR